jgi:hypothetical protein
MNGAITATYKNRIASLAYGLLRLCSNAFRRFGRDRPDFDSGILKDRHRTLDECCSPLWMLARNRVGNQRNTMHPM